MALYPKRLPQVFEGRDLFGEGLLSINEAMAFLGVCRQSVYNLMENGRLPFVTVQGFRGRRIPKAVLKIFVEHA